MYVKNVRMVVIPVKVMMDTSRCNVKTHLIDNSGFGVVREQLGTQASLSASPVLQIAIFVPTLTLVSAISVPMVMSHMKVNA